METIGYVERGWKPPRKNKIELQIEKEDVLHWATRKEPAREYKYTRYKLELTEVAKHAFGSTVHFISSLPKL